jgi:hypothetical protein
MYGKADAMEKVWNRVRGLAGAGLAAVAAVAAFGAPVYAAELTMPVDFAGLAEDGMAVVGTVMGAIAGIIIVIALVRMGFRFLSSAFQGRV